MYFNTPQGCIKGKRCHYRHETPERKPAPALEELNIATAKQLQYAAVIAKEKRIAKDDPFLWQIVQAEWARVLRQERDHTKSSNAGSREDPDTDANIGFPLIIEAIASRQREWINRRTYTGPDWDDRVVDTQSTVFVEVIDQTLRCAPERQLKFIIEQRIHDILLIAFKPGTRRLIPDQKYQNLSRSVLEICASIILISVYNILSLPLAHSEKTAGWYMGVVLDLDDPTWYKRYVGQSICIQNRAQCHLRETFTKDSYHYSVSRQSGKSVTYVVLGTLNLESLMQRPAPRY